MEQAVLESEENEVENYQTTGVIMKTRNGLIRLGELIELDIPASIGVHHRDSGISISADTSLGRWLRDAGIYYICPHERACADRHGRENWCPECRKSAELREAG